MNTTRSRRSSVPIALKTGAPPKFPERTIKSMSAVFKLLADESRLKILLALYQNGELHVNALCDLLGESQPAVSHNLTWLRMGNLVDFRRNGRQNLYSVDTARIREILDALFGNSGAENHHLNFQDFTLSYRRK